MKIAITGSEGFIGRALSSRFEDLGHEIIRIDLLFGRDILDYEQISKIPEFDIIFHLAGRLIVPESYIEPYIYYKTNFLGTLNILELCRVRNKGIVFFSSYLYGQPIYQPIDELHPISPFNPYAQSKFLGEQLCLAYNRDFKTKVIVFRPFNIYGPGQNIHFLIPKIIKQCKSGLVKLNDPRPKRDFIYIDDAVSACVASIGYNKSSCEIFNIGFGTSTSIPEIINSIQNILNKEIEVHYSNEYRKNEVLDTICNNNKAVSLLNWIPAVTIDQGLKKILESEQNSHI